MFQIWIYTCIYGHLYPSEIFSYNISELILMFEYSLTDCVLWVLLHIIWWPEWYNHVCFGDFYDDRAKTFCRGFSDIENFYITLYRSDVSEYFDAVEHMRVWSSIRLYSGNFYGSCMKYFLLVSNHESTAVLTKILWIINDVFCIILISFHDTWVHCWRWKIVIKVWVNMFELFFSDQFIICIIIEFILFELIFFHVLFLCINGVSIFMGMFHMVGMVIGIIKADSVYFLDEGGDFSLRRACIFGCIFIFIEFLWYW